MTWLVWAVAAAACVQIAPNPLYVAVVLAISFLVVSAHRLDTTLARAFPILVGLGVAFAVLRVALTALTTHSPAIDGPPPYLWFTLPQATLPRILGGFTVGGTIEGDIVLYAAAQAFAVVGILGAFGVFNAVASHHELVQAAPRAFHEPGLILTVALAFVPSTMRAVTDVREADRARTGGRVVRRGRLVRSTVPILESGLERAVALAESMDARGFARQPRGRGDRASGWLGLVAWPSGSGNGLQSRPRGFDSRRHLHVPAGWRVPPARGTAGRRGDRRSPAMPAPTRAGPCGAPAQQSLPPAGKLS